MKVYTLCDKHANYGYTSGGFEIDVEGNRIPVKASLGAMCDPRALSDVRIGVTALHTIAKSGSGSTIQNNLVLCGLQNRMIRFAAVIQTYWAELFRVYLPRPCERLNWAFQRSNFALHLLV